MLQKSFVLASALATALAGAPPPTSAVDALGHFELDGNATQEAETSPPDDWETLHAGGGSATVFTGVMADPLALRRRQPLPGVRNPLGDAEPSPLGGVLVKHSKEK